MGYGVTRREGLISLARETYGGLSIHSLLGAIQALSFLWVSNMMLGGIMVEGGSLEMIVNLRLQVQEREY